MGIKGKRCWGRMQSVWGGAHRHLFRWPRWHRLLPPTHVPALSGTSDLAKRATLAWSLIIVKPTLPLPSTQMVPAFHLVLSCFIKGEDECSVLCVCVLGNTYPQITTSRFLLDFTYLRIYLFINIKYRICMRGITEGTNGESHLPSLLATLALGTVPETRGLDEGERKKEEWENRKREGEGEEERSRTVGEVGRNSGRERGREEKGVRSPNTEVSPTRSGLGLAPRKAE